MRIISFVNKDSGPCYHRLIMPLLKMNGVDVFVTNNLLEEHFDKGCDLFIYNRILPDHAIAGIKELQNKYGFKICVDIDDYWELDEHHILYQAYQEEEYAKKQIQQLRDADFVTVTHERLRDVTLDLNPNVHIVPNAIPHDGQFDIVREPYYLTRLFWQGSITHRYDLDIISHVVHQLAPMSGKIKMVMGGYMQNEEEWYHMAMSYTAGCKHQYRLIPGAPVTEYYDMYKHADICLVPLIKSRFNGFKSNLKILEAANLGLPVIASNVDPYLDMPLLYCKSGSDWLKHIKYLLKSRKRQRDAGLELKFFCEEHYNFNKINIQRKQIFEYETGK